MFVSQTSTTLAMKLGRTNADEKRHKVEVDFEARLLILGEFHTVGLFTTFGSKVILLIMLLIGGRIWLDFWTVARPETKLSVPNELRM